MQLKINEREFDVDVSPLKERLLAGVSNLIQGADTSGTHSLLRQLVKQACNIAIPVLGIEKSDRNADPIALVAGRIIDIVFVHVKDGGIALEGRELFPASNDDEAGKSRELLPFEPEKEASEEHADTSDGRRPVGDTRGDGLGQDVALS